MKRALYSTAIIVALIGGGSLSGQTWMQKQSTPGGARDAAISFTIGSKVYYGAGNGYKDFAEFDPSTATWTRKADVPGVSKERAFGSGFSINGKGYVTMGYDGNTNLLNDLWEYDPATDTWTRKANFPGRNRDGMTCFVVGSKAYVGGGSDNVYPYGDFYEYDPATDKWTEKGNLPMGPVIFQAAFTIGSYGYVVGGGISSTESEETWRYDPSDDTWTQMADYPGTPRQCAVGFALNGLGYVGFGQSGYSKVYNDFYSYNPATDKWRPAGNFPTAKGRAWATAAVAGGKAYMGSGWDLGSTFSKDWWEMSVSVAGVDVADLSAGATNIYPNPATNSVTVCLPGTAASGRIELFDALGRQVFSGDAQGSAGTLDLSGLPSGVYMVRSESGSIRSISRLVKQ